jgi:hypothetical protein
LSEREGVTKSERRATRFGGAEIIHINMAARKGRVNGGWIVELIRNRE